MFEFLIHYSVNVFYLGQNAVFDLTQEKLVLLGHQLCAGPEPRAGGGGRSYGDQLKLTSVTGNVREE